MALSSSILDELQSMPAALLDAAAKISPPDYSKPAENGDFSLLEQACHLRDLEKEAYLVRISRILQEECPHLEDFDGAKIAAERNYRAQNLPAAITGFERARSEALRILRSLSDRQLERTGRFAGTRTITLRDLVEMMLEHDRTHRREIAALLEEMHP